MLLVIAVYPAYISGSRFASPISEKPMANRLPIALLSLLLALPASALAQAPSSAGMTATTAALPAVAFGTVPAIDNVTLSLDGKLLASAYVGKQVSITILDLVARKPRHRIAFDQNMKLRSMGFVDDTTLLVNFSTTYAAQGDPDSKSELGATFAINAEDGSSRVLMEARENNRVVPSSGRVASRKGGGPGEILMTARLTDLPDAAGMIPGSASAYILAVNTKTGAFRPLEKGGRYTGGWLFDTEGRAQIRIDSQFREMAKEGTTTLRYRKGDDWIQFHEATGRDFNPIGLGADGKSVLVISALGGDRKKLWTIPVDGSGPQLLFQDPDHDVEGATTDRYDGRLLAVSIGGLEQRIHWLDADAEGRQASVAAALPGRRVNVSGYSRDGRYAVAFAQSRTNPGAYFLVDFQTNRAEIVGQEYPALAKSPLGPAKLVSYRTRDGYTVPAYLTLPPGIEAKNLPVVMLPHGGPEARDSISFDWWSQFVATRGYAVLQPQFRGSTGFGEEHRKAGYRQWGRRMQDDVSDGVKYLVDQGIADPTRVCIVGASYGGYAALAGATLTPDLYRCAVSVAGVADLTQMIEWVAGNGGPQSPAVKYWRQHIGDPGSAAVDAISPARHVEKVHAAVMLMHGKDDTIVPFEQSEIMAKVLQKQGKAYELVRLDGEDHWLSRSETRTRMLQELERFLGQHLGPTGH